MKVRYKRVFGYPTEVHLASYIENSVGSYDGGVAERAQYTADETLTILANLINSLVDKRIITLAEVQDVILPGNVYTLEEVQE